MEKKFILDQNNEKFLHKISVLESSIRRNALPPEEILKMVDVQGNSKILDIGAGSGYLTIPAAKQTSKEVYALDFDERMLKVIKAKSEKETITNIHLLKESAEDISLADNSINIILASLILHEVPSLNNALHEIHRLLETNGQFLCLEYDEDEEQVDGPPKHIRISSKNMEKALFEVGFYDIKKVKFDSSIYIMVGKKK